MLVCASFIKTVDILKSLWYNDFDMKKISKKTLKTKVTKVVKKKVVSKKTKVKTKKVKTIKKKVVKKPVDIHDVHLVLRRKKILCHTCKNRTKCEDAIKKKYPIVCAIYIMEEQDA